MRPLNKYSADYYGLTEPKGILITDVERGSFGERAGILSADILIKINGKAVTRIADAATIGSTIIPGEFVEVVVWRNRREVSLSGLIQRAPIERLLGRIAGAQLMERSHDRARAFYEYLAVTDDAQGQADLGFLYLMGLGVQRDFKMAESWLLKAALQGKTHAAALLSGIYLNPSSGIQNNSEALRWAKFSAEAGVPEGATMLAAAQFRGVGTTRNATEGVRWARMGAEQGQTTSMLLLGVAYENGIGGVPRNSDEAKMWYRHARDGGSAAAKTALQRLGD